MKILVTGSSGFIGKNLVARLLATSEFEIIKYDLGDSADTLKKGLLECDFFCNLAGVNRPVDTADFKKGNADFLADCIDILNTRENKPAILLTSSIQAELNNPYGESKKQGEELIKKYCEGGGRGCVYRLPNVFGKWCRPNYNSAVATFCHNIANDLAVEVRDRNHPMSLVYIDDVVDEFTAAIGGKESRDGDYCYVPRVLKTTLGEIVDTLYMIKEQRETLSVCNFENFLQKALYSTYLSYLPEDKFAYDLKMNIDNRGSFTEVLKTTDRGQVSINVAKPGVTKGNHWHDTKTEKFLIVSGSGEVNFRKIDSDEVIKYSLSGDKLQVVDIPPGYTHNIVNTGESDLVTVIWCNELLDKDRPDTYFLEV